MRNPAAKLCTEAPRRLVQPLEKTLALCPAAKTTADAGTKDASESESETETEFEFEPPASFGSSACAPRRRARRGRLPSSTAGSNTTRSAV